MFESYNGNRTEKGNKTAKTQIITKNTKVQEKKKEINLQNTKKQSPTNTLAATSKMQEIVVNSILNYWMFANKVVSINVIHFKGISFI